MYRTLMCLYMMYTGCMYVSNDDDDDDDDDDDAPSQRSLVLWSSCNAPIF